VPARIIADLDELACYSPIAEETAPEVEDAEARHVRLSPGRIFRRSKRAERVRSSLSEASPCSMMVVGRATCTDGGVAT
jgi:hypothetical protein